MKKAGINALAHYLRSGQNEGRQPKPKIRTIDPLVRADAQGPVAELLTMGTDYSATNQKIAVHFHAYHLDLVDEAVEYLANIQQKYTLLVSAKAEDVDAVRKKLLNGLLHASINVQSVTNRGRDVAPWVGYFRDEILQHDLFCHIHTKSTEHTEGHKNWRKHLLHETLASPTTVSRILTLLDDPEIGLVMPPYFNGVSSQPKWGANRDILFSLLDSMNYQGQRQYCENYPAGSFFWAKTTALKPLFELNLKLQDFEPECGQNDGTLAHAIERVIGFLPSLVGLDMVCTAVEKPFN